MMNLKTFAGLRRARVYPCRGPRLPFACPCACYDRIHVTLPLPRERALCVPTQTGQLLPSINILRLDLPDLVRPSIVAS